MEFFLVFKKGGLICFYISIIDINCSLLIRSFIARWSIERSTIYNFCAKFHKRRSGLTFCIKILFKNSTFNARLIKMIYNLVFESPWDDRFPKNISSKFSFLFFFLFFFFESVELSDKIKTIVTSDRLKGKNPLKSDAFDERKRL